VADLRRVLRARRRSDHDEAFVNSPMRDNWYQSSSYWPSSFALITTVDDDGNTNVAPYQLSFPFEVISGRSLLIISRQNSNTEQNIKRTGTNQHLDNFKRLLTVVRLRNDKVLGFNP